MFISDCASGPFVLKWIQRFYLSFDEEVEENSMPSNTVIDVRPIPKPQRHPLIFAELDKLAAGESLVIKNDHNPIPLRGQVEEFYPGEFVWKYLEEGPEIFRLCFTRVAESKGKRRSFESTLPVASSGDETQSEVK
jgi:uncharacterized protein (DUF2249 family)